MTRNMSQQKPIIRIGLLGFGVVGQGVWKNIENNRQALEFRLGARLEISQVVVKDAAKSRAVAVPAECYSTDPARVVENPEIDIVCELMGGTDAALDLLGAAGFDPVYGARPLKRTIQTQLENPLAQEILAGRFGPGDSIRVDVQDGQLAFVQGSDSAASAA